MYTVESNLARVGIEARIRERTSGARPASSSGPGVADGGSATSSQPHVLVAPTAIAQHGPATQRGRFGLAETSPPLVNVANEHMTHSGACHLTYLSS
jgi:hypothetical protein